MTSMRIAFALVLLTACTLAGEAVDTTPPEVSQASTTPPEVSQPSTTLPVTEDLQRDGYNFTADEAFVRGCQSRLSGGTHIAEMAEPGDRVGPLYLFLLHEMPTIADDHLTPAPNGDLVVWKYPTELATDQPVWLAIGEADRNAASLIYDASKWGGTHLPLSAGYAVTAFEACTPDEGPTQYNGGILVTGPMCLELEVWEGDPTLTPEVVQVEFGQGAECELD